jgi:hypothetical protein
VTYANRTRSEAFPLFKKCQLEKNLEPPGQLPLCLYHGWYYESSGSPAAHWIGRLTARSGRVSRRRWRGTLAGVCTLVVRYEHSFAVFFAWPP